MINVYTFALAFIFLCVFFESDRSVLKRLKDERV